MAQLYSNLVELLTIHVNHTIGWDFIVIFIYYDHYFIVLTCGGLCEPYYKIEILLYTTRIPMWGLLLVLLEHYFPYYNYCDA